MNKINVLIADDNKKFNELLTDVFNSQPDFNVCGSTYDGIETLKMIGELKPDLLILDIIMPYLDGIGVIEKCKELLNSPKIVVISAVGQENISQKAINMGALYYFVKPFDLNVMVERIRQLLKNQNFQNDPSISETNMHISLKNNDLENEVSDILKELGVPAHIKGYQFLRDAIIEVTYNMDLINSVTKTLYPQIAEKYQTTPTRVERAIRHAIEVSSTRGKLESLYKYFKYSTSNSKGKPTNSEFIAIISDNLRLKLKSIQKI
ncbi:sporulation transcription factor Spo0A [Caldicellulosiruptoraceae bacterium PP1]